MAKTPREQTPDEIKQQEFIDDASELDDLDDDLNPGINEDENSGTTDDDNSANNDEVTDAEISGLEAPNRVEPSKIEKEETEAEADKSSETIVDDKPKEEPTTPEKVDAVAEETPEQTPPVVEQEKVETPVEPESFTPDQMQEVYKDWRGTTENLLADHHYALKQEELEEFEVEPNKVISRLMARVYLDAVTASINQITSNMPRLVSLTLEENRKSEESENVFFERWPQLKEQSDLVRRIGANYRTQNMTASPEQFINEVGAAAMVALRLDPSQSNGKEKPNGKTETAAKPFVPITSTPTSTPAKQQETNQFTLLNNEFDEEDADFG